MKRPLALCMAVVLATGCRGVGQTSDPFFGRSTVAPPRTGAVAGARTAPLYSGTPAPNVAPRPPAIPAPSAVAPLQPRYQPPPVAQPVYPSGTRPFVSSPATAQPRLLPGAYSGPVAPPVSAPAAAAPVYTPPPVYTAPPMAPVPSQPTFSPPPAGPTLRPAAAIPAPAYQGQCCPNPYPSLAERQRIVRPLGPRPACNPCPPGTVPVPCVPLYDPRRATAPTTCPINITDLPEPK